MFLRSILMAASLSFAAQPKLVLQKIGSWTGETTFGMQVRLASDTIAFTAGHGSGLGILNIKDPSKPVLIGPAKFGSASTYATAWLPGKILLAQGDAGITYVVDVTNPTAPKRIDSLVAPEGLGSVELDVKDSLIFAPIYNPYGGALATYRWTAEGKIQKLGSLPLSGKVWSASVQDTLVAVSLGTPGVAIVSVKDPAKPVLLSTIFTTYGSAFETVWNGNQLWCINNEGELKGYDVSTPTDPKLLADVTLPGIGGRRLARSGNSLFVTQIESFSIIDIQNPKAPILLGSASGTNLNGITANDSLVLAFEINNGLTIYRWKLVTPPNLIPTSAITRTTPTLAWHAQIGVKEYLLSISADSSFKTPKILLPVSDTGVLLPTKLALGTWWWKVANLPDSVFSAPSKFDIISDSAPLLHNFNGDTLTEFPIFRWSPSIAYKGVYSVDVSSTADFKAPLAFEVTDTSATLTFKPSAGKWYWRVSVGSAVSPIDSFTYKVTVGLVAKSLSNNSKLRRTNTGIEFMAQGAISFHSLDGKLVYAHPSSFGTIELNLTRTGLRKNTVYLLRNGSTVQTLMIP